MKDFRRKTLALVLAGLTMLSSAAPTFADTMDESVQTSSESVIDSEDAVVASSVVDSSAADEADTAETDEQEDTAVTDQSETKETTEDAAVPTEEAAKGTEESSSENAAKETAKGTHTISVAVNGFGGSVTVKDGNDTQTIAVQEDGKTTVTDKNGNKTVANVTDQNPYATVVTAASTEKVEIVADTELGYEVSQYSVLIDDGTEQQTGFKAGWGFTYEVSADADKAVVISFKKDSTNSTSSGVAVRRNAVRRAAGKKVYMSDTYTGHRIYNYLNNVHVGDWKEWHLTAGGNTVYCMDTRSKFVPYVYGTEVDISQVLPNANDVKFCAMAEYYFNHFTNYSTEIKYLLAQCTMWSKIPRGCSAGYKTRIDPHDMSLASQDAAINACLKWIEENQNACTGSGKGYKTPGGQDTASFSMTYNPKGNIQIQKSSANTTITNGNPCYNIAGTTFHFDGPNCSFDVVLGSDGKAASATGLPSGASVSDGIIHGLQTGAYSYHETVAGKGYQNSCADTRQITIGAGETQSINVTDEPGTDPIAITVSKSTPNMTENSPSLEGTQFTVKYYAVENEGDIAGRAPTRTWVFAAKRRPNGLYTAGLNAEYKVSGDDLYLVSGIASVPYGYLTIEETKPADGYENSGTFTDRDGNDLGKTVVAKISEGTITSVKTTNSLNNTTMQISDTMIPEIPSTTLTDQKNEQFTKAKEDTVLTDTVDLSRLNSYLGKTLTITGKLYDKDTGKAILIDGKEVTASTTLEVTKETDTVQNVFRFDSSSLEGKTVVATEILSLDGKVLTRHEDLTDTRQMVHFPKIGTTATDDKTDDHESLADGDIVINDLVHFDNLKPDTDYTVHGILMDKDTGEELLVNDAKIRSSASFNTSGKNVSNLVKSADGTSVSGDVLVVFRFPADYLLDGKTSVAFEEIKDLAVHADIDDTPQTVHFPKIGTTNTSKETGHHVARATEETTIVDTVQYHNLITDGTHTYTVRGTLMDKASGKQVCDKDGNAIVVEKTFTPTEADGTIDIPFTFKASELTVDGKAYAPENVDVVAYEHVYNRNGVEVAFHADITDEGQTVHFTRVHTSLRDTTGDSEVTEGTQWRKATDDVSLTDTVLIENVKPLEGQKITVKGTLMDQETGKEIQVNGQPVTAEATVTVSGSTSTFQNVFHFDASSLAGKTVVATEHIYDQNGAEIGTHVDLTDTDQMVHFPKIGTQAKDNVTGNDISFAEGKVTIIDTVDYKNLQPNTQYTVYGTLMDRKTGDAILDKNGKKVQASTTFTSSKTGNGSEVVTFVFDAADDLKGKTGVAFEEIPDYATHTDLADHGQTIHFPEIGTTAMAGDTKNQGTKADEDVTIVDTVAYKNLVPGRTYTMAGVLMDKESGKALTDADGNEITSTAEFTPEASKDENGKDLDYADGTVDITFTFDSTLLKVNGEDYSAPGKDVVVFETCLDSNDNTIAIHTDINDEGQTIHFPDGHTNAMGKDTNSQNIKAEEKQTIVDTLSYKNLLPNHTYQVTGTLMIKPEKTATDDADSTGNKDTENTDNKDADNADTDSKDADASGEKKETVDFYGMLVPASVASDLQTQWDAASDEEKEAGVTLTSQGWTVELKLENGEPTVVTAMPPAAVRIDKPEWDPEDNPSLTADEPTELLDADGNPITSTVEFTTGDPEEGRTTVDGTVDIEFTIDASLLAGRQLVVFEDVTDNGISVFTHADINDTPQTIFVPDGHTTAIDSDTGTQMTNADEEATIVDTVSYENLLPETEYTVNGILMNQETGDALLVDGKEVTGSTTFTTPAAAEGEQAVSGTVDVVFAFDASALKGQTLVVFEDMLVNGVSIFTHADITDTPQTIYVPGGHTTAIDSETGNHTSYADKEVKINDRVDFTNLMPGKTYTLDGTLMDRETGKALQVDGKDVTAQTTFTIPTEEELKADADKDAENIDEETDADTSDTKDEEADTTDSDDSKITDVDSEKANVDAADEEIDAEDVEDDLEAEEVKDPTSSFVLNSKGTVDGFVTVTFTFDGSATAGKTLVAFEEMTHEGKDVFVHANIDDTAQTIYIPKIGTTATDKADGDKNVTIGSSVSIKDEVSYTNLTPGTKYTVNGTLMNKKTGKAVIVSGKAVTATTDFTPEKSDGKVSVIFTFNASGLSEGDYVVFEQVIEAETKAEVASHEDLNDKGQTVALKKPAKEYQTGDVPIIPIAGAAGTAILVIAIVVILKGRKKKQ